MAKMGSRHSAGGNLKRFIGNKNTVTVLGLIACIAVLIVGYNIRVSAAISPKSVPYAKQAIPSRTAITADMIGTIKISGDYVNSTTTLVANSSDVVGKYVSYKTSIPAGSLFYKSQLMDADEMPDYAFSNIQDGYTIYSLDVSQKTTAYNSIRAGDYIDIYMSTTTKDETGSNSLVVFGCLVKSIRVLAVKDSKGNNITKSGSANGKPYELLFAVEDDLYKLLKAVDFMDDDITLEPLIRNANYTASAGSTEVSSEYLRSIIEERLESFD